MDYQEFETAVKARGGKIGFMSKGAYMAVHALLGDGETVMAASECTSTKGPGAMVVTDRNFHASKFTGMLSAEKITIPLEKISSFSISGINNLNITEGTLVHTYPSASNPRGIVGAIRAGKASPTPSPAAAPAVDAATELRKFKALLDDGIITQEDFDKKKTALLGI
jgi:hypothetical protein